MKRKDDEKKQTNSEKFQVIDWNFIGEKPPNFDTASIDDIVKWIDGLNFLSEEERRALKEKISLEEDGNNK